MEKNDPMLERIEDTFDFCSDDVGVGRPASESGARFS
jgi:hypothetical protein